MIGPAESAQYDRARFRPPLITQLCAVSSLNAPPMCNHHVTWSLQWQQLRPRKPLALENGAEAGVQPRPSSLKNTPAQFIASPAIRTALHTHLRSYQQLVHSSKPLSHDPTLPLHTREQFSSLTACFCISDLKMDRVAHLSFSDTGVKAAPHKRRASGREDKVRGS